MEHSPEIPQDENIAMTYAKAYGPVAVVVFVMVLAALWAAPKIFK